MFNTLRLITMANNAREIRNQLNAILGEETVNEFFNQVSNLTETVRQQVPIEIRRRRPNRQNRRSNRSNNLSTNAGAASDWPLMNVVESNNMIEVSAEVPGLGPEDINLELKENFLVLRGKRDVEELPQNAVRRHLHERRHGSFYRTVPVYSGVSQGDIIANYVNGVLYVTIPKPPEPDVHRIHISGFDEKQNDEDGESEAPNDNSGIEESATLT